MERWSEEKGIKNESSAVVVVHVRSRCRCRHETIFDIRKSNSWSSNRHIVSKTRFLL